MTPTHPALRAVVLDATDARALAEFWRQLLGFEYRAGDEPPPAGEPDTQGQDWLVLRDRTGDARLAIQWVEILARSTWPAPDVPQQLHLDLTVADMEELTTQRDRALALGATLRLDRSADLDEPLYVFADPAGHPFCIFVSPDSPRDGPVRRRGRQNVVTERSAVAASRHRARRGRPAAGDPTATAAGRRRDRARSHRPGRSRAPA